MEIEQLLMLNNEAEWQLAFPPDFHFSARPDSPDWKPWATPHPALPIDDFISCLIARGTRANLKSRADLANGSLPIVCPYYHARYTIWLALGRARMWVKFIQLWQEELPSKEAKQKASSELANVIELHLKHELDSSVCFPFPNYSDRIHPEEAARRAKNYRRLQEALWEAQALLRAHTKQSEADRKRIRTHGNSACNAWKEAFAAELGYAWTSLTGNKPTLTASKQSLDFRGFVSAAFLSIGGGRNEKWDRSLRRILHERPPQAEGDGFDRYEKDNWPRGTVFVTTKQWEAKRKRLEEQAERDLAAAQAHLDPLSE